jgi:2-oxo-4-hydroxy-4-carboxy-5-ureidoimidazoline decarboxylase
MSAAAKLDAMSEPEARAALARCCGASSWIEGVLACRPFRDDAALHAAALRVWSTMDRADILAAFDHHPRIGADLDALREKFSRTADLLSSTADLAAREQAGAIGADESELSRLRDGNLAYEARFGHIFIVCATGKTAAQMADLLDARLGNDPETELRIAAAEQAKITALRLESLA